MLKKLFLPALFVAFSLLCLLSLAHGYFPAPCVHRSSLDPLSLIRIDLYTPQGGSGPNASCGSYEPYTSISLYAQVTDVMQRGPNTMTEFPAGVAVNFKVINPNGTLELNTTANTNPEGLAAVNFTIPENAVFGDYMATASCSETFSGVTLSASDRMPFKVCWAVSVQQVFTVDANGYFKNQFAYGEGFYVSLRVVNVGYCAEETTFAVTANDNTGQPIGFWNFTMNVPVGTRDLLSPQIKIPQWSLVGSSVIYATVSHPKGAPLAPEASTPITLMQNEAPHSLILFSERGDANSSSTVLKVDDLNFYSGDLPFGAWVYEYVVNYSYCAQVQGSVSTERFILLNVTGAKSPVFYANHTQTVQAAYKTQYQITFNKTGITAATNATLAKINNANYTVAGLPQQFWWDNGSEHTFSLANPVTATSALFGWISTSGLSTVQNGTLKVTAGGNVIANYKQVLIKFSTAGVADDYQGAIIYVDGVKYNSWQTPLSFSSWTYESVHRFIYQPTLSVNALKRYVWTNTTDPPGSIANASDPYVGEVTVSTVGENITSSYKTQYYFNNTSPHDTPLPSSGWFDVGSQIKASVSSISAGASGVQYVCIGWVGAGNVPKTGTAASVSFVMVKPTVITWLWKTQYYLTVVSHCDSATPESAWFDNNSIITAQVSSQIAVATGVRYVCLGWNGTGSVPTFGNSASVKFTINTPSNITWLWATQYFLTVSSPYDTPSPASGWFNSGTSITASVSAIFSGSTGVRYACTGWSGTGNVASSGKTSSLSFVINMPSNITWLWKTQYYLTVSSAHDSPSPPSGWSDSGTNITASVSAQVLAGNTQYICTGWAGTGSVPASGTATSVSFTINAPSSITWLWQTQFYLTISTSLSKSSPVSGWFNANTSVTEQVANPVVANGNTGTYYYCYGWAGTGSVPASGTGYHVTFTIAMPSSIRWLWRLLRIPDPVVIFNATGIDTNCTSVVLTVDGVNYTAQDLPIAFCWDNGSVHTFTFYSLADGNETYAWNSTTGLTDLQNGTITVNGNGNITASYTVQRFSEAAVNSQPSTPTTDLLITAVALETSK